MYLLSNFVALLSWTNKALSQLFHCDESNNLWPFNFFPLLSSTRGLFFLANFHTMMTKKLGNFHLKIFNSKKVLKFQKNSPIFWNHKIGKNNIFERKTQMLGTFYYMDERLHPFLFNKNKMKKRIWFLCFFLSILHNSISFCQKVFERHLCLWWN